MCSIFILNFCYPYATFPTETGFKIGVSCHEAIKRPQEKCSKVTISKIFGTLEIVRKE